MTNAIQTEYAVEMKKAPVDFLMLPRDTSLNIRIPTPLREALEVEWKRAQKLPGGERLRTFTDYVIERLSPKE